MLLNFKTVAHRFNRLENGFRELLTRDGGLTDDGEVDLEVSGRRVAKINSASVNTLVGLPQVSNRQLGGWTRFERGPLPPKVGGAPQLRLAELSIPRVVAAKTRDIRNLRSSANL